MQTFKKKNIFFFTTSIIALLASLYVLYITVFEQLISQSSGYFYAGVFGFILLLVFLLCNLFTKLVAISSNNDDRGAFKYIAFGIAIFFAVVFAATKLSLISQLAAEETRIYKSAVTILDGSFSQNKDLVQYCMHNPSAYLYALVLSIFFNLFSANSLVYLALNTIIYSLCLLIIYHITLKFSDRICGLISIFIGLILPAQSFAVFAYDSNPIFSLVFLAAFDLYTEFFICLDGRSNSKYFSSTPEYDDDDELGGISIKSVLTTICAGIVTALLFFIEPVMILVVAFVVIAAFVLKKNHAFSLLIVFAAGFILMILLCFAKSANSNEDFGNVVLAQTEGFNFLKDYNSDTSISGGEAFSNFNHELGSQDKAITDSYFFIYNKNGQVAYTELSASWKKVQNQVIYMFLLVMTISCIIIAMKENMINISLMNIMLTGLVVMIWFEQNRDVNKNSFLDLLAIFTGVSIHYLYLNHHPEQLVKLSAIDAIEQTGRDINSRSMAASEEEMTEEEFLLRSEALIFVGSDEGLYQKIKQEEHQRAMKSGAKFKAIDNSFDDYDDDFFFDDAEAEEVINPAIEGKIRHGNPSFSKAEQQKPSIPAWKQRPEKFGDDDMFFDEDDEEETPVVFEVKSQKQRSDSKAVKSANKSIKNADNKKINEKKTIEKESVENKPAEKKPAKKVSSNTEIQSSKTNPKYIDNPLPVPKRKQHKPMDYDKKITSNNSGWDYDYDIDDDDDWDV